MDIRDTPTTTNQLIPCAGGVVVDDAGRLLLVRRGHAPAQGTWSLPGGRVEPGETAAQAARREIREETGLTVDIGELLLTAQLGPYIVDDFAATVVGGQLAAGDDASEARWFSVDEIRRIELSPGLLDALRELGVT